MGVFTTLLTDFDKSIENVNLKKAELDKAQTATAKASDEYNKAIKIASDLREKITVSLGGILPSTEPGRVRTSTNNVNG